MNYMPENTDFPKEHFPPQLNGVTEVISGRTQAPVELIMGTCLSAMSLASQALVIFQYSDGRVSPVSLYNVVIAESGERKTAVFNQVMKPILDFEKQAQKAYLEQVNLYDANLQAWKAINKSIIKLIRKNEEQRLDNTAEQERLRVHYTKKPEPPKLPKLIYNDATYEAIVKGLSENIGSAGLFSDEGGGVLNGRALNNSPFFNQLWDGASFDIERKDHRLVINDSRFVMLILTQLNEFDSFIRKRGERTIGNGFFARCLWSVTTSTQGQRNYQSGIKSDDDDLEHFYKRINELLTLTAENTPPKILHFSHESEVYFTEFQRHIENQIMIDKNKHNALPGILSKIPENVVRLATLIHFFCEFEGKEIDKCTLEHVIFAVKYYYGQIVNLLTQVVGKEDRDAKILHHWLLKNPIIPGNVSQCMAKTRVRRYGPYQLRDGTRLDRALKILEEHGHISISRERNHNGSITQMININRD
ncbi:MULTISPECIES: YfjI family protein [unclassified Serratia (in: enterobacteria)]|uniref:YfjI family protein n=1 Tax=unclassified Serratia (in: enterobacteria) TaxID=2647522 RepID=UPI003076025C